jgi:hypothetical protein
LRPQEEKYTFSLFFEISEKPKSLTNGLVEQLFSDQRFAYEDNTS